MTNEERSAIEKAIEAYNKRMTYNKAWRERNEDKVKAMRTAYNKKRYAEQKALLKIARDNNMI
jgi:hypothetical protein